MANIDDIWESFEPPPGMVAQYFGGNIVIQANPTQFHDLIIRNIVRQDFPGVEAWGERGVDLGRDGKPAPDLVFIAPEDIPQENLRDWPAGTLQAVAEVISPSSAKADWRDKRELYAQHAIPHYLVIDPRDATWHVLRLDGAAYVETADGIFGQPIPLSLAGGPAVVQTRAWHAYPPEQQ
jgi:Uma2 family endonuclease